MADHPRTARALDGLAWSSAADRRQGPAARPEWQLRPDLSPPPEGFVIIQDTREQAPLFPRPLPWVKTSTLHTGDYSLEGFEDRIAVERKSLADAYGTIGRGRDRFTRELERLAALERRAILIESTYADLLHPERVDPAWRAQVRPAAVEGSLLAWSHRYGVEILFAGRALAPRLVFRWLALWWIEQQAAAGPGAPQAVEVDQ